MKIILPPIIAILLIIGAFVFIGYFPDAKNWLISEGDFDIFSPLFIIRNGTMILLGVVLTFVVGGGFTSDEPSLKAEFKFLLPLVIGMAGAGIMIILMPPLYFPKVSTFTLLAFILASVVSEELFFRSFLTRSLMNNSNPEGLNIPALLSSSIIYAFWNVTYHPVIFNYNFFEYMSISLLYFVVLSLPVTASYYYSRSLISSGLTNITVKVMFVAYCVYMLA